MSPSIPLPQRSWDPTVKEEERVKESEGMENMRRTRPPKSTKEGIYELTETEEASTGPI